MCLAPQKKRKAPLYSVNLNRQADTLQHTLFDHCLTNTSSDRLLIPLQAQSFMKYIYIFIKITKIIRHSTVKKIIKEKLLTNNIKISQLIAAGAPRSQLHAGIDPLLCPPFLAWQELKDNSGLRPWLPRRQPSELGRGVRWRW